MTWRAQRRSHSRARQGIRVLVFDYSGHPFQAQLARLLADRGHDVVHGHCAAYESGKGQLDAQPGDTVRYVSVGDGCQIHKYSFVRRFFQELRLGAELAALIRRESPDVALIANTPVPALLVASGSLWLTRMPWVLWHQDVNSAALASFAAEHKTTLLRTAAPVITWAERWTARRAARIVVIAEAFRSVHARWGTLHKTTVIPNWAPVAEIGLSERRNRWAREHGVDAVVTLLYSGTLGLKHNPSLMVSLTRRVRELGLDASLVVVSEGPASPILEERAAADDVPLVLVPFQPYNRLPEVLGSADVLLVLLEPDAGSFSVPSKALTYLCAGRPILGLVPPSNAVAALLRRADCLVLPPAEASIDEAARWIASVIGSKARAEELGAATRMLAEREFSEEAIVKRFEDVLLQAYAGSGHVSSAEVHMADANV